MSYFLSKQNWIQQVEKWQKQYPIYSPRVEGKDWQWKKFFLPSQEILFRFLQNKIVLPPAPQPFILLGLSPVDLAAIMLLDKVLKKDPYYQKRRCQAILIGLGPKLPSAGHDLFCQEHPDYYQIYIGSSKGQSILSKKLYKKTKGIVSSLVSQPIDPLFADPEKLSQAIKASVKDKIWDRLAKICFGCGICAYVCPLCYCFSSEDVVDLDKKLCPASCQLCSGTRKMTLDSCFSSNFSQIAGGHNFRPKLRDRIYNWYHHKFVRFPQEYGQVGCVSCGRCIKYCPARINYRKVLEEVLVKYS